MSRDGIPEYRPEDYIEAILERISQGITLRSICREEGHPGFVTVYGWLNSNKEYAERFARARKAGMDAIAEQCIEISDETPRTNYSGGTDSGDVQHRKLQIETRLKLLAKWDPGRYGDRIASTTRARSIRPRRTCPS